MSIRKDYVRPIDFKQGRVDMTHGAGGRASAHDRAGARERAAKGMGRDLTATGWQGVAALDDRRRRGAEREMQ